MASLLKILMILCMMLSCTLFGKWREPLDQNQKYSSRLDPSKPTVYLIFKEEVKLGSNTASDDQPEVRLELHNNTVWTVYCYLKRGKATSGDALAIYKVESDEGSLILQPNVGDTIDAKGVGPGKSVSFLVRREYLKKGRSIFLEFNYEWERNSDGALIYATEPSHRVYFSYYKLPKYLRQ